VAGAVPAVVKPRPRKLAGRTYRMETPLGTAFVVVNENGSGEPFEVFVSVGKAGSDTMAVAEAMGRLISLILRMPSPFTPTRRAEEIVSQLTGIGGGRPLGFGAQRVLSLPDGIARVLAEHLGQVKVEEVGLAGQATKLTAGDICPECGQATFVYEEGCKKCYGCGFNEC
jgi:ribonucleoside-diphosphate reductase alpha chain